MSFYYCIFSVACLEEENFFLQKWSKMATKKSTEAMMEFGGPPPKMDFFHQFLFEGTPNPSLPFLSNSSVYSSVYRRLHSLKAKTFEWNQQSCRKFQDHKNLKLPRNFSRAQALFHRIPWLESQYCDSSQGLRVYGIYRNFQGALCSKLLFNPFWPPG